MLRQALIVAFLALPNTVLAESNALNIPEMSFEELHHHPETKALFAKFGIEVYNLGGYSPIQAMTEAKERLIEHFNQASDEHETATDI